MAQGNETDGAYPLNIMNTSGRSINNPASRNQSPAEAQTMQMQPQLLGGDVYEFHSSPEEESIPMGAGGVNNTTAAYFPIASSSAISVQQKSSSASSIPSIGGKHDGSPAPKRIKTAVLAKKLIAAAVDSNIINPSSLPITQNERRNIAQRIDGTKSKEDLQKDDDNGKEGSAHLFEDEEELGELHSDQKVNKDFDCDDGTQPQSRAHSFCYLTGQEKKVPPLRISLLKTPSEEGEVPGSSSSSSELLTSSLATRRSRGTAGRASIHGKRMAGAYGFKKGEIQRITRSRVRQNANTTDDDEAAQLNRKRRNQRMATVGMESAISSVSNLLEEEETTMSSVADLGMTEEAMDLLVAEEEQRSEDSQQSAAVSSISTTAIAANEKEKTLKQQQEPSVAALLLAKNSFEQSVDFETMLHNKWAQQYKAHMNFLMEKMKATNVSAHQDQEVIQTNESKKPEAKSRLEWPETLNKLYIEHEKRRRELMEEHQMQRHRIQEMAQREINRSKELHQIGTNSEQKKMQPFFPIVSYLRDMECYDPGLLAADSQTNNPCVMNKPHSQSVQQIQQRFTYLANTTKNRHAMEAQVLAENQKAEWKRTARKSQREIEQQQILLKGPIGGAAQLQQPSVHFPTDFWIDSAVYQIPVIETKLPQFQISNKIII